MFAQSRGIRKALMGFGVVSATLVALMLSATDAVQARPVMKRDAPWEENKAKYDELRNFKAFDVRALAVEFLASTGKAEAFEEIRKRYEANAEPKEYRTYFKWAMMYSAYQYLATEQHARSWKEWAEANVEPMDAWLWLNALSVWSKNRDGAWHHLLTEAQEGDLEDLPSWIRACGIHIGAERGDHSLIPSVTKIIQDEKLLKKEPNRSVYLIAAAQLLDKCSFPIKNEDLSKESRDPKKEPEWQELALACCTWMDERKTLDKTKLILARAFARIYGVSQLYMDGESWMKVIKAEAQMGDDDGRTKADYHKPKFAGVQGTGTRIAFLIDLSDSMLKPLALNEKADMKDPPKDPITGKDGEEGDEDEDEKKKDEIDWDEVKNRWDAAREVLKQSLRNLDEEMYFTVILFGTEADYLKTTTGLVQASRSNVEKAIKELEAEKVGPPIEDREFGTLRGFTNLHGALRKAYTAIEGGQYKKDDEYVSVDLLEEGVDTIFVLSDGDPSICDWPERDRTVDGYLFGDAETRTQQARTEVLDYKGPYQLPAYIEDDLLRLNLFRRLEINCVCIGEFDEQLMDKLKVIGNGSFRNIPGGIRR